MPWQSCGSPLGCIACGITTRCVTLTNAALPASCMPCLAAAWPSADRKTRLCWTSSKPCPFSRIAHSTTACRYCSQILLRHCCYERRGGLIRMTLSPRTNRKGMLRFWVCSSSSSGRQTYKFMTDERPESSWKAIVMWRMCRDNMADAGCCKCVNKQNKQPSYNPP